METITLTFGDIAENHVGMQKIGSPMKPISTKNLKKIQKKLEEKNIVCEYVDLCAKANMHGKAAILIVRNGIQNFVELKALFDEQKKLEWDTKALMRGTVKNKHARHNLCYADFEQKANFEEGKGTVIDFKNLPCLSKLRKKLEKLVDRSLVAEGNRYFDSSKCGIGYHGDTERNIVIGCRLGASMSLHYQWFHRNQPYEKNIRLELHDGDIYIMSKRAVGNDWKKSSKYTLRHAAGCDKYTNLRRFAKKS